MSSADAIKVSATTPKLVTDDDDGGQDNDDQSRIFLESLAAEEQKLMAPSTNPYVDNVDLSNLRGTKAPKPKPKTQDAEGAAADQKKGKASPQSSVVGAAKKSPGGDAKDIPDDLSTEEDLENLAELVPGLKSKQDEIVHQTASDDRDSAAAAEPRKNTDGEGDDILGSLPKTPPADTPKTKRTGTEADAARWSTKQNVPASEIRNLDSMVVMASHDEDEGEGEGEGEDANVEAVATAAMARMKDVVDQPEEASSASVSSDSSMETMEELQDDAAEDKEKELKGFEDSSGTGDDAKIPLSQARVNDSSHAQRQSFTDDDGGGGDRKPAAAAIHEYGSSDQQGKEPSMPGGLVSSSEYNHPAGMSSGASLSTATQTHEVRMPMYLPTFKPATGCTNASDFIVRCFVARLRSGITVVKHGRSRWCKSRLRILHVHTDGRSLSWKPALGEPSSSKRPPKLDLSTCTEVRHAWSPDPLNPMYTGTPILRQKCEAANAHKSFALIFPKRTVDITAITADQCKVLMEGFSALCFRLQVANLASRGKRPDGTDDDRQTIKSDTVSNTNTSMTNVNTNTTSPAGDGGRRRDKSRR
mmetsp:Transcript_11978/g.34255  ORF Transcript_11978/g.34255 Transcript_11978/m.34255 type:complete len:587 (-) Transcript_11978:183-1943(-)|eukprot:CAMPEP_0181057668 /NCGR_PEP_ID=MMETSP1070-20121207/20374_1 /TAXON_ID=265543 /ORGANISM="Minutocellus polymorphus, Strain NH13" /LENGTH=586 /DNA_ID=CAMNT_0023137099 /DNA_START=63 /DNA_END=1823 /DNA_ORIENTATION=+